MTKFYIRWHMNPHTTPTNPEERVKLWMTLLEGVKNDFKAGIFKDWGNCSDLREGYCISELDEKMLDTAILKYVPYIIFDIRPVLTVDQVVESIQRAVAAAKTH